MIHTANLNFLFQYSVVECYDDTNICLFALKNITFMENGYVKMQ